MLGISMPVRLRIILRIWVVTNMQMSCRSKIYTIIFPTVLSFASIRGLDKKVCAYVLRKLVASKLFELLFYRNASWCVCFDAFSNLELSEKNIFGNIATPNFVCALFWEKRTSFRGVTSRRMCQFARVLRFYCTWYFIFGGFGCPRPFKTKLTHTS